jgi:alpha-glucosidase (family GH31 glycosyl hydrolase)
MYAGHWTGDNQASWNFLRLSISGNFLYQIFGIQMVGADICGFHQDTTS